MTLSGDCLDRHPDRPLHVGPAFSRLGICLWISIVRQDVFDRRQRDAEQAVVCDRWVHEGLCNVCRGCWMWNGCSLIGGFVIRRFFMM